MRISHQHVSVAAGQAQVQVTGGGEMSSPIGPMHRLQPANAALRCSARSTRSGCRCRAPAARGRNVCRMHGARAGAPAGQANGRWRHGLDTKEALAERRSPGELMREVRSLIAGIGQQEEDSARSAGSPVGVTHPAKS